MLYHFEFSDGSNPYISMNEDNFLWMFRHYDIETLKPGFYRVLGLNNNKSYEGMKEKARDLAIEFQATFDKVSLSWFELSGFQSIFETLGSRYGLLREYRENTII